MIIKFAKKGFYVIKKNQILSAFLVMSFLILKENNTIMHFLLFFDKFTTREKIENSSKCSRVGH